MPEKLLYENGKKIEKNCPLTIWFLLNYKEHDYEIKLKNPANEKLDKGAAHSSSSFVTSPVFLTIAFFQISLVSLGFIFGCDSLRQSLLQKSLMDFIG